MSITLITTTSVKPQIRHRRNNPFNRGFTLIEVLVTVVVVSIGLLGLAGLQINGLRANMSSEARSKATVLASDIIERMRANPLALSTGDYDNIDVNAASCATAPATLCGNTSSTTAAFCTEVEMAAFDIWEWGCGTAAAGVQGGGVTNQLPTGTATINCADNLPDTFACTPGSPNTITISWSELNPSATGAIAAGENVLQTLRLIVVP